MTLTRTQYSERAHDYCRRVVAGELVTSKWIRLAAQRHLTDLATTATQVESRWYYDAKRGDSCCAFIETLTLESGQPFILTDWQVWLTCSLVAWVDTTGLRKYIEAYINIAKGNGKTPWAAAIGLHFAFLQNEPKAEVYCGAVSLQQADEVHRVARHFVTTQPAFAQLNITAQKTSIFSLSGSRFKPVIGRGRHGTRNWLCILDEFHQAISPDLYETLKSGCTKRKNSLLLTITTAGLASISSPCYQLQVKAIKAIDGSMPDDRFFTAIYAADDTVEWDTEEALVMSNPNLGVSNDAEKIRLAIQNALTDPVSANNIKAMHLGIWSTTSVSWLNMAEWQMCINPDLTEESVKHLPCWDGYDFAPLHDLTAWVRVYRDIIDGKAHYYIFCNCFLPEDEINLPQNFHLQRWARQGFITATDGAELDYAQVRQEFIDSLPNRAVREFCFDPAHAIQWAQEVEIATGITKVETPHQPIVLTPPMMELEAAIAGGRVHTPPNDVLTWCLSNVVTRLKANGLYAIPDKERSENKIDAAMALLFALHRARLAEKETSTDWSFKPFWL